MNKKPWASAMGIGDETYEKWIEQAPPGESFTYWCLIQNKIDENQYLEWASHYYELPFLKEEYFDHPISPNIWEKQAREQVDWNESMLPVAEWDKVIFIACVEPPIDIQWKSQVQYVLAPASGLIKIWNEFHHSQKLEELKVPSFQAQINFHDSHPPSSALINNQEDLLPSLPSEINLLPSLEGINKELIGSIGSIESDPNDSHSQKEPSEIQNLEMPQGLSFSPFSVEKKDPSTENENTLSSSDFLSPSGIIPPPLPAVLKKSLEPEPPPPSFSNPDEVATHTSIQNSLDQPLPNIEECINEEQIISWGFHQFSQYFAQTMLLIFEGNKLRPWKWDEKWQPKHPESLAAFDITSPCIFRIVRKTKMPYHGYIVNNPTNDRFFKNWSFTENLPSHVTINPLQYENYLIGMVLSVGTKESSSNESLAYHEKITFRMAQALYRSSSKVA